MAIMVDLKCRSCNWISRDVWMRRGGDPLPTCPKCASPQDRHFEASAKVHTFREGYYDNIDMEPIWIKDKKHLKRELTQRGLTSFYLW